MFMSSLPLYFATRNVGAVSGGAMGASRCWWQLVLLRYLCATLLWLGGYS